MLETNRLIRQLSTENSKLLPLSERDVADIQAVLLGMMDDFDAFCRENGLRYFLCGGTALGAVRHGGFIPWDEDVDIAMPRADYNRFLTLFGDACGDRYFLQTPSSSEGYSLPFVKIRKRGTRYVEVFETDPDNAGVFIDVYPLENVPDFAPWRWLHGAVSDFLHLCCSCVRVNALKDRYATYYPAAMRTVSVKAFLGKCLGLISLGSWCRAAEKWASCCHNETTRFVTFPGGRRHYFGERFSRASALPLTEVTFAGRRYQSLADPTEHLRILYGDFTRIPPPEERLRHSILELDLGEKHE